MKRTLLFIGFVLALTGCADIEQPAVQYGDTFKMSVSATQQTVMPQTRTSLSGTTLSWVAGDKIGVYIDGLQANQSFKNTAGTTFDGSLLVTNATRAAVNYYAYYPYNYLGSSPTTTVNGNLTDMQTAPFDGSANYMVADAVSAAYDEANMPAVSFTFANQLFSIVKITVNNTDAGLASQKLVGVSLEASGTTLAGAFTFDITQPTADATFSDDAASIYDKVSSTYDTDNQPTLGQNTEHSFYLLVKPTTVTSLKLLIKTTDYVYAVTSSVNTTFDKGKIETLPTIDLNGLTRQNRIRKVVLWGDSITSAIYLSHMQQQLGSDWEVIRGGIPGDTPLGIAGRQGGIPLCLKGAFTIPAATQSVEISRLYSTKTTANVAGTTAVGSSYYFATGNCSLLNPCEISGVKGNISYDESTAKYSFTRLTAGEAVSVTDGAIVTTYGASVYKNADVIVTYMGANSGYASNGALAAVYQAMADYQTNGKQIVVGFHMDHIDFSSTSSRDYWTTDYRDTFTTAFGANFLDLRTVGNANASRLLVATGVYSNISQISSADQTAIADGDWPASFSADYLTNVHPNSYGLKAMAILVKEKMNELGYLEY